MKVMEIKRIDLNIVQVYVLNLKTIRSFIIKKNLKIFPPKVMQKTRSPPSLFPFYIVLGVLATAIKQERKTKGF